MSRKIITVKPDGTLQFIYNDKLRGLLNHGKSEIKRASHVEATTDNRWTADMSPVDGPLLGPFDTREEALAREVEWLNDNVLSAGVT